MSSEKPTSTTNSQEELHLGLFDLESGKDPNIPPFDEAFLAASSLPGVGMRALRALVARFGDQLGALFDLSVDELSQIMSGGRRTQTSESLANELLTKHASLLNSARDTKDDLANRNVRLVRPNEIPAKLSALKDGPLWLFVQGDVELITIGKHVAIVGTRDATERGVSATRTAVHILAAYPISIISGLAEGIDAAAHSSALAEGVPNVAVLGHGINHTFPASTKDLRQEILRQGGAIISEYPPDEHYRKQNFVQRNRIQAGLAELVVAVEGKKSGGTAHTVRFSSKYNRPIIGFDWAGAGDLNALVREQKTGNVIEIFSPEGRHYLDTAIRSLALQANLPTSSLSLVHKYLKWEAGFRAIHPADLNMLQDAIDEMRRKKP